MSRDYLSIHSLAPHERVTRTDSSAPSTLGTPSRGPDSKGAPSWDPYQTGPANARPDRLEQARAVLTHGAALIDEADSRMTFLDLVRFIDSPSEAMEAMDILADLAATRKQAHVREMRTEIVRMVGHL